MAHQKLPFHADTVGSYLRSDAWKKLTQTIKQATFPSNNVMKL